MPEPVTEAILCAAPGRGHEIAVVLKRTLAIRPDGRCVPADPEPLETGCPAYEDVEAPRVSPPRADSDVLAFKEATDLVVQGHAWGHGRTRLDTWVRCGPVSRAVRVHGDRELRLRGGRAELGPAAPFDAIPLRFDRAYGGFDAVGHARQPDRLARVLDRAKPSYGALRSTRWHYPRNPAGCGFVGALDVESVAAARVPNLELPDDPITAERLAVGDPAAWPRAPLPAAYDWVGHGWFPRCGYVGATPEHDGSPFAEVARGWAPAEATAVSDRPRLVFDPRFLQGASPGLGLVRLPADAEVVLGGLFPDAAEQRVRLPGVAPRVTLAITSRDRRTVAAALTTVRIRPDDRRVVLVWSARFPVDRPYAPDQLEAMPRTVSEP